MAAAPAIGQVPLPDQMPLSGAIFKFHKGASQEFLQRYLPDLKCQPFNGAVLCMTPVDEISQIFIRNVKCAPPRPITYTIRGGKAVSASCHVSAGEARRLNAEHSRRFGPPATAQKDVPPMLATRETWKIGNGDEVSITHFYGNDIQGRPIEDYVIGMAPQEAAR
ncbi:hypothetical protein [Roseateles asaccharophilus]|uniref:hypothetical protein n=1 Tax=Roseateles asaccharophilus TaxID=582607 RepID=UPI00384F5580